MPFELHSAAKAGDLKLVESLIKNGADVNLIDDYRDTPLHKAIQGCSTGMGDCTEIVKRLVAEKKINLEQTNIYGETPLLKASFEGLTKIVKILLESNANANVTVKCDHIPFSVTPLVWACYLGYTEIAKLLIEHGADINVVSMEGKTPIVLACSRGLTEIVELFLTQEVDIKETLLQEIYDSMKTIDFPNKNASLIEITKLVLPALLLKYPSLPKLAYILENTELSSAWEQSKKVDSFSEKETTTLHSLTSKFFAPNIASNDAKAEKTVPTTAQAPKQN